MVGWWAILYSHSVSIDSLGKKKMTGVEILAKEFGYVVLVIVLYIFLNFWMTIHVDIARKKYYKVLCPTCATEAENKDANLFNCVQRGHQNSLEMMPTFFILSILGGIRHPLIVASLSLIYTFSRYFLFTGYFTGDPQKRSNVGVGLGVLGLLGLLICTISCGVNFLLT